MNPPPRTSNAVELAPRHKLGLTLPNPVLLAAGVIGYGDVAAPGFALSQLGGYVTAPVTRRAWRSQPPQLLAVTGGVLWQRGWWNPGMRRVVRDYGDLWRRSPAPVIVHVAGDGPDDLASVAAELERQPGVSGLELDVPADGEIAPGLVWTVREAADLPLLARLPLHTPDSVAQAVLDAGADALVVAQPPDGLHVDPLSGRAVRGQFYGAGLASLAAARIADLATWVQAPLVACGGVFSVAEAALYLQAGAVALQIDVAVWIDPALPGRIVQGLNAHQDTTTRRQGQR
jgi:dihydroorotate dehydrogenase (NAD+) catalytic subunit